MSAQVEANQAEACQCRIGELLVPAQSTLTQTVDEEDLGLGRVTFCLSRQHRAIG